MEHTNSKDSKPGFIFGNLRPTVAQFTGRYDVTKKVQRTSTVMEPGMFLSTRAASPTYLPAHWSPFIHPEGKLYFHRNVGLSVVTDAYLYTSEIGERICAWASVVEKMAYDKGFLLPIETVELFLQLDRDDCNYYFIDRSTQALFWLEQYNTSEIGVHPTVSPSHLKLALEIQYWAHIENFCMHFGGLHPACLEDLILVFSHALADTLTSKLSTFPYEAKDCEKFLNLLTTSRGRIHEGYTVTYVARLWGVVVYNRYETHFGQEQSRLSRDASILVEEESENKWVQSLVSLVTFKSSEQFTKRLDEIFNDKFVYGTDWETFMAFCNNTWDEHGMAATGLLLLHILCYFVHVCPVLAYVSCFFAALSMISSVHLTLRHKVVAKGGASAAHEFLSKVCSPRFKFQLVALAYALPHTFLGIGLTATIFQGLYIFYHYSCTPIALGFLAVCFLVFFVMNLALSDIQLSSPRSWIRTIHTIDEAAMV